MRPADQQKLQSLWEKEASSSPASRAPLSCSSSGSELGVDRLLLQLEDRDAIEQRVEGGASQWARQGSRAGGGGSHQQSQQGAKRRRQATCNKP